jgi:adenylate kinase
MRIVILGAPGSGKRTQTALVAEKYGLSSVMTGELVKNAVSEQTPLGIEIKELQNAGRVVTEDIVLALLREQLLKRELQAGFILDGFPRNLLQALTLDELMIEIDRPLDLILLIDIETDTLMERLVGRRTCRSCGLLYNIYRNPPVVDGVCDVCGGRLHLRSDDNEETVSNRIHVFDHLISPLITHYEKQEKLVRIDGNGEIDQVFTLICEAIAGVSRVGAQAASEAVTEAFAEKREEIPVADVPGESSTDEVVASTSGENKVVKKTPKKRSAVKATVKKQVSKKKAPPKQAVKKKTTQKKSKSKPAPVSRTVKKKSTKKKLNKKKALKGKVVSKQKKASPINKSTKLSAKKKTKRKTNSTTKSSKSSGKSSRSSVQRSGKAVKKHAKKSASKKAMARKSSSNKSALKKAKTKTRQLRKK